MIGDSSGRAAGDLDRNPISRVSCLAFCAESLSLAMAVAPFNLLADAETACVCHFLDTEEIVRLARCNHRLLSQASSTFAFRHSPMVWFHFAQLISESNASRSSLLQFARSACRFSPVADASPPTALGEFILPLLLSHLPAGLCELEFDLALDGLTPAVIPSLLTHESCAKIRGLRVLPVPLEFGQSAPVWCDTSVANAIARLARLTHLRMPFDDAARDSSSSSEHEVVIPPDQHFPLRCERLQHLDLLFSLTSDSAWDALFSVVPPRIESLTLNHIIVIRGSQHVISAEQMRRAFASLSMMHSLTLRMAFDIDELLPHLVAAPALRCLILDLAVELKETAADCMLPSVVVLDQLLIDMPSLHCRLLMCDRKSDHRARFISSVRDAPLYAGPNFSGRVELELGSEQQQAEVEALIKQRK